VDAQHVDPTVLPAAVQHVLFASQATCYTWVWVHVFPAVRVRPQDLGQHVQLVQRVATLVPILRAVFVPQTTICHLVFANLAQQAALVVLAIRHAVFAIRGTICHLVFAKLVLQAAQPAEILLHVLLVRHIIFWLPVHAKPVLRAALLAKVLICALYVIMVAIFSLVIANPVLQIVGLAQAILHALPVTRGIIRPPVFAQFVQQNVQVAVAPLCARPANLVICIKNLVLQVVPKEPSYLVHHAQHAQADVQSALTLIFATLAVLGTTNT